MATDSGISAGMFLRMLGNSRERETVSDGIKAAIRQYYEDYSEADALDSEFRSAIEKIAEYADEFADVLVETAQEDITDETGRRFAELS